MSAKRKSDVESGGSNGNTKKKSFGHWAMGLKSSMDDPNLRLYADSKVIIIKDKFPKAKHHFLVLPIENINSLKTVGKEHVDLLKYMEEKGREIAKPQLHLHVISDDLDSPCLKTKKHFNSFTTAYFIDSAAVIKELSENGTVSSAAMNDAKILLDTPLRCHKCGQSQTNMPTLKKHIKTHCR